MTLISQPGHWQQMALASLDAGLALDITVMLNQDTTILTRPSQAGKRTSSKSTARRPAATLR